MCRIITIVMTVKANIYIVFCNKLRHQQISIY